MDECDAVAARRARAYLRGMVKRAPPPASDDDAAALRASLKRHGALLETSDPDAPLPPGVTHVLVPGKSGAKLVEKRKSFF